MLFLYYTPFVLNMFVHIELNINEWDKFTEPAPFAVDNLGLEIFMHSKSATQWLSIVNFIY